MERVPVDVIVDAIYEVGMQLEKDRPDLVDPDEWADALRARLAAAGHHMGEEEFLDQMRRLRERMDRQERKHAVKKRLDELALELNGLTDEYDSWFGDHGSPVAAVLVLATGEFTGPFEGLDPAHVEAVLGRMESLLEEARRIMTPFPELAFIGLNSKAFASIHQMRSILVRLRAERAREERLRVRAEGRGGEPAPAVRLCSTCGKKPARVDDLCKRCAHDAGILPHGKIGEG